MHSHWTRTGNASCEDTVKLQDKKKSQKISLERLFESLLHLGGSSLSLIMLFVNLTQTHILVVGNSGYVSLNFLNMPKIDFSFKTKYFVIPVFQLPQHLYYWQIILFEYICQYIHIGIYTCSVEDIHLYQFVLVNFAGNQTNDEQKNIYFYILIIKKLNKKGIHCL